MVTNPNTERERERQRDAVVVMQCIHNKQASLSLGAPPIDKGEYPPRAPSPLGCCTTHHSVHTLCFHVHTQIKPQHLCYNGRPENGYRLRNCTRAHAHAHRHHSFQQCDFIRWRSSIFSVLCFLHRTTQQ